MMQQGFKAKGHMPRGAMNRTEQEYARLFLDARIAAGEVLDYRFHPGSLRLAPHTYFEPDFLVILADCQLEYHEVKGAQITDDGWAKLKIAAAAFPFITFRLFQKTARGWEEPDGKEIPPC